MPTPTTLAGTDLDYIVRQIEEGAAAVDSWSRPAAGGFLRPDDAREYWAHLPVDGTTAASRVARVTVYRTPDGSRWRVADVDIFTETQTHDATRSDDHQAAAIAAAVDADRREIVRHAYQLA